MNEAHPTSHSALLPEPPHADAPTDYDWTHRIAYLRLLDADNEGADWTEVARIVLQLDVASDPDRAHSTWAAHLARAKWMTVMGYRRWLCGTRADR